MTSFWHFFFTLLKITGLAPLSFLKNSGAKSPFKFSTKGTIYNVFFLTFYTVLHLGFVFYDTLLGAYPSDVILFTLTNFFILITFLIVFITISTLILRQKEVINICDELYEIHRSLETCEEAYLQKKMGTKLKSLIQVNIFLSIFFPISNTHHEVIMALIFFNVALVSFVIMQYVWIVAVMVTMIETINEQFRKIDTSNKITVETSNNSSISTNASDMDFNIFSTRLVRIEVLQEVFLKLMKATADFDRFYSFVMLVCIIKIFFSILVNLFSMINSALKEQRPVIVTLINLIEVLWLSWDIFLLLLVTYFGTKLASEVIKTCVILRKYSDNP